MPEKMAIGTSRVRTEYVNELRKAWTDYRLVLFLGAGVSVVRGIPNWNDLVLDLLLEESTRISGYWPPYRKALGAWLVEYFDFSPLMLARIVKTQIRRDHPDLSKDELQRTFRERLRNAIYRNVVQPPDRDTLTTVADFIARAHAEYRLQSVVTFNFDDLLERELQQRGVRIQTVHSRQRHRGEALPIVHVHGYVPQSDDVANELIFTEDDYNRLTYSVFHWGLSEIANALRNRNALMIGLSMTDPSLRRIFDAVHEDGEPIQHFLVRKEYALGGWEQFDVTSDIERRAEKYRRQMRRDDRVKDPAQIVDAVRDALRQAHSFDRELFKDLGIGTLWLEDWADIAPLLDAISGAPSRPAS